MRLPTRRQFAKTSVLLPLAFARGAAAERQAEDVGTLPRHVERVPETPFDGSGGAWTLAVMPDSQHDAAFFPEVILRQTEWIAAHRDSHRIAMLAHLGDVTDDNSPRQWERVRQAFDVLLRARFPFSLTTGNHDLEMVDHRPVSRSTRLNDFFPADSYNHSHRSGLFQRGRLENSWHEFEAPPMGRVLVLSLEMAPPEAVIKWARTIIAERRPKLTVLVTHAYLYHDGTRYDYAAKGENQSAAPKGYPLGDLNDGEDLWRKLIKLEPSISLVLCGHATGDGEGHLISCNDAGGVCHQILSNYQLQVRPSRGFGSGGFLRLLQFQPDNRTVRVRTYSPWYNVWLSEPEQNFTIDLRL